MPAGLANATSCSASRSASPWARLSSLPLPHAAMRAAASCEAARAPLTAASFRTSRGAESSTRYQSLYPSSNRYVVEATKPAGLPPASSEWNRLSASSYAWASASDAGRCEKTYASNLLRLWSLARLDVSLEPFHVVADAFRVLARQQTAGKTQQARELVVHLVNDVRAILAF